MNVHTSPLPTEGRSPLRVELIDKLVQEPKRCRRLAVDTGQDMTKGLLCPECWTEAQLTAALLGTGEQARQVPVEYFRSGHWSVWVGRCIPCNLLLYAMRFDEHPGAEQ